MAFVLALDQGTTSSRAIVFDESGTIRGSAQREFEQILPQPGWVEHDAETIWATQSAVIPGALDSAGASASDVRGVGITNQRETTVLWDRSTGEPLGNAIVWQDRRTADMCDRLRKAGHEEIFQKRTGLLLDPYFSGTKLAWMLENIPEARRRAEAGELAFGTIDCWLTFKLTGGKVHATDASNASRTLLWNLHSRDWDDDLLDLLGIPRAVLPEVRGSSEIYGEIETVTFVGGVPLAGMIGDQQAALAGQLCTEPGLAKCTYGTGCFLLLNTGAEVKPSAHRMLTTVAWRRGERTDFAFEGSTFIGGAVVQWLRDGLQLIRRSEEVEALADQVEDNGGVYLVPGFVGLGAPHWDPYARGMMIGITRGTTRAHIARAALQSIAFQVADLVSSMEQDAGFKLKELRVDGGAAVNDGLLQFQADLLGVPVVRPTVVETTALGAAYMAGLAVGYWPNIDAMRANWRVDKRFEPKMAAAEAARLRSRWSDAVERSKGWEQP
ncbi:glycerol kinase [Acidobacteria bacterium Mor1]|nr:glycerol kinase [Acidobacteria bacterium Mor1]